MDYTFEQDLRAGGTRRFALSAGLVRSAYCKDSGCLPCSVCRLDPRGGRISSGYFKAGGAPRELCTCHVSVLYHKAGGGVAGEFCPRRELEEVGLLRLPERSFPQQVYVADAQYACRAEESGEEGVYHGVSPGVGERPFHASCPCHGTGEEPFDWLRRYFMRKKEPA